MSGSAARPGRQRSAPKPLPVSAAVRPTSRLRKRRMAVYVGLAILLLLIVEGVTGWLLWVAAHRRAALATAFLQALPAQRIQGPWIRWLFDVPVLTDVHVELGYVLLALTGVKLWAVWWLLRHWFPRRLGQTRLLLEKVAAWSLPIVYGVILASGVVLDQRFAVQWGRDVLRDVHLWSSELAVPVTGWHLLRFLPTVWQVARRDLRRVRA